MRGIRLTGTEQEIQLLAGSTVSRACGCHCVGGRRLNPTTGTAQDLKTIASSADVDLILTGTLLSAGEEIRVTAQLTDAANGTLVCSHSTQTSIGNVFRLQDELTECVVDVLALPLTAREQRIFRQDVPSDAKAYEYYLRGNQFSHDSKQWGAARDLYLRCVEVDPCYAPAWARLGRIHHVIAKYLTTGAKEGLAAGGNGVPTSPRPEPRPRDRS